MSESKPFDIVGATAIGCVLLFGVLLMGAPIIVAAMVFVIAHA